MPRIGYHYPTDEHAWVVWTVGRNTGYAVAVNPALCHTCVVDRDEQTIEIREGLRFAQYLWTLTTAAVYARFNNPALHLGFRLEPHRAREVISPGGIVVPLRQGVSHRQCDYPTAS
jgi:hypothetical protein